VGLFLILYNWIHSLVAGRHAPANPWGANSLEWHTTSPPPHENFYYRPLGEDPYNFGNWRYDETLGGYVLDEPKKPAEQPVPDTMQPA